MNTTFDVEEFADEVSAAIQISDVPEPEPVNAMSVVDIVEAAIDPGKTLLGNRLLCTGGSMLFVGPSGVGKSSASMQQDILWGLGRPAFGIQPTRPLVTVTVQAENDVGDLGEMAKGVLSEINPSSQECEFLRSNVHYVHEQSRTSWELVEKVLRPICEEYHPDILRLDPLMAYLGGDPNSSEVTAEFLRGALNPLLHQYNCAAVVNHHTPKITNRDTSKWRPGDFMYAGLGASDVTNWARAILVIEPTSDHGVFKFVAAKRGKRFGWRNPDQSVAFERHFAHSRVEGKIAWAEADAAQIELAVGNSRGKNGGRITPTAEQVLNIFLTQNGGDPRKGLLSNEEVLLKFKTNGWDKNDWKGLRDQLQTAGKLAVLTGAHNSKLIGRPGMVEAYGKAKEENGTILEARPLPLKP